MKKRIKLPEIIANDVPQVGPFLRHLRSKFGLTQEFIANKISISRPTLNKIEAGKADITLLQAKKLADFYNIPLANLLNSKDSIQNDTRRSLLIDESEELKNQVDVNEAGQNQVFVPEYRMQLKEEVCLYVCEKLMAGPSFFEPSLKLVLFLIEVRAIEKIKHPLPGFTFIKNASGPEPDGWQDFIVSMISGGLLSKVNIPPHKFPDLKLLPLRQARFEIFYGNELVIIDEIISSIRNLNEVELKQLLETIPEYQSAEIYQTIKLY